MPQTGHRKKPFSAKQKKEQLREKRERKRETERDEYGNLIRANRRRHKSREKRSLEEEQDSDNSDDNLDPMVRKLNKQPTHKDKGYDPNRYKLHFLRESNDEIERRKVQARIPFDELPESELEVDLEEVYVPGSVLDMPKRPSWDYNMSKQKLLSREEAYFKAYIDGILEKYSVEELSYFEVNLETWRQLWRVIEMADIVLLITDIRHPALHFSPALYNHVTKELHKPLVLILNKIDLAAPEVVVAWKHYFMTQYPALNIVCFTSFPRESQSSQDPEKVLHKRRRKNLQHAAGPKELLHVIEKIVQGQVNLSSWHDKMDHEIAGMDPSIQTEVHVEENPGDFHTHEAYRDGILTLGCCGCPNVGKSSIINGLMGKKVVSVSKTPGHTKHFQTIFLTPKVKLCDSPGLVYPSLVSKPMQVLSGIFPIAQVREPYSAVGYLAQRIPVQHLLVLRHPRVESKPHERTEHNYPWSANDICEAWAEKRGFLTAKAARNDVYRAANHILRLALDGRLCMCTRPPGFTKKKEFWVQHPETREVAILQEVYRQQCADELEEYLSSDSDIEHEHEAGSDASNESDDVQAATNNPFALLGCDN